MRVLVTGGRNFADYSLAYAALDMLHFQRPITVLVEGGAKGADAICKTWAIARGVRTETYFPDWDTYGKRAGILRNSQMLDTNPEVVLSFPGGKGTLHCTSEAYARGRHVLQPAKFVHCGMLVHEEFRCAISEVVGETVNRSALPQSQEARPDSCTVQHWDCR